MNYKFKLKHSLVFHCFKTFLVTMETMRKFEQSYNYCSIKENAYAERNLQCA